MYLGNVMTVSVIEISRYGLGNSYIKFKIDLQLIVIYVNNKC